MNHHQEAEVEKGYSNGHDDKPALGAGTLAEATGRGGETHRGLKSRHIQFLYECILTYPMN
jgi:amino acid transporter